MLVVPEIAHYRASTAAVARTMANDTAHPLQENGTWVLQKPGGTPSSRSDRSDGLRHIENQMRLTQSQYHMPLVSDDQRSWEAWFSRVLSLQKMFPHLPASLIIPSLTGALRTDDRRIYGWQDQAEVMRHEGREPSLEFT